MIRYSVLAVGDELLIGKITNTNASYIAKRLNAFGHVVSRQAVCADDAVEIKKSLDYLLGESDYCIVSGGLGITPDDITKQIIADYCGVELVKNERALSALTEYYKQREICDVNKYLNFALMPQNCEYLENTVGIAAGMILQTKNGKSIALLPGPPRELIPMFESELIPRINDSLDDKVATKYFMIEGLRESEVVLKVKDLFAYSDKGIVLSTYCAIDEVSLVLRYNTCKNCDLVQKIDSTISDRLSPYIYATDNKTLEYSLFELLSQNDLLISTAESITGGLIASKLVNVPGISQYFKGGVVSYSAQTKNGLLGVGNDVLKDFGEVSEETARAMCEGLIEHFHSDVVISTTGIAGPATDGVCEDIGKCFLGIGVHGKIKVYEERFYGNRENIRESAAKRALFYAIKQIENNNNN